MQKLLTDWNKTIIILSRKLHDETFRCPSAHIESLSELRININVNIDAEELIQYSKQIILKTLKVEHSLVVALVTTSALCLWKADSAGNKKPEDKFSRQAESSVESRLISTRVALFIQFITIKIIPRVNLIKHPSVCVSREI